MNRSDETTSLIPHHEADAERAQYTHNVRRRSSLATYESACHEDHVSADCEAPSAVSVWLVIPICLIGVFVANADGSLVVVSSQQIASEFDALSDAQWLVTSYILASCASQPLYGKLSDVFGRKSNLAVAYLLFAAGLFLCGVGQTLRQVLTGRAISGIGGAGMTALISVIIADIVPVRDVAACRSYVNVAATVGRALGGPIGGWLCDTIGWRWAFYGQVPLTILGLLLILWKMPTALVKSPLSQEQTFSEKVKRIDVMGALFLAPAITSFLLAFDFAAKDGSSLRIIFASIAFVVFSVTFWALERFYAKEPILPLRLLVSRATLTSYLLAGFQTAAQFGTFYSTPLYYQIVADNTVAKAGGRLVPAVVGNVTAGLLAGWMISRTGRYKHLTIFGSAVACCGYSLIVARWRGSTNWPETLYIFLGGFGSGAIQSTAFIHLAANLELEDIATAGTTLYLAQSVFTVVGLQSSTALLHAQLLQRLDQTLDGLNNKAQVIKLAVSNVRAIKNLPLQTKTMVIQAYVDGLTWTFGLSFLYALLGLMMACSVLEKRL